MTVFRTFWKVIKKYKGTVMLYTIMLIAFGGINMQSNDMQGQFVESKPNILIMNEDSNNVVTQNLIEYMESKCNIADVEKNKDAINDALFYRQVNYVIYIPENYGRDVMNGFDPKIDIKSTGDYNASLAEMILSRYIQVQNIYSSKISNEKVLVDLINNNLSKTSNLEVTSKIDVVAVENASRYFSFASYSIMAVVIFVVCLVMSSFNDTAIKKRIVVSSMDYKKHNLKLLLSSFGYACIVWLFFVAVGVVMVGDIVFTDRGLVYMLNSFVFTICSLTVALLISTLVNNKDAVSGIVNVIALGSAFLCGAFVPAEWLPKSVLTIAQALPAYWYINSNNLLKTIEVLRFDSLMPIYKNCLVMIAFSIMFIVVNNILSKQKQKVG